MAVTYVDRGDYQKRGMEIYTFLVADEIGAVGIRPECKY